METSDLRPRLRAMVRGAYDLQQLRQQAGLRLCANFKSRLGALAGESEDELDESAKKVLDILRDRFRRLTDGVARNRTLPARNKFVGDEIITDYTDLILVGQYLSLEREERAQFTQLELILPDFPIYVQFLEPIRGVGPAMAGVIISEFDIHKARYPSSLWMYAGLDVGADGRGRSRRKEHLVKRTYTNAKGELAERDSVTFNPFLKTKLVGVLAGSFLRLGSPYAEVYRNYRHRLETDPARPKCTAAEFSKLFKKDPDDARRHWTPGRINDASKRYMIKMFLKDLYNAWRPLEGLEVAPTYQEAKLGHAHRAA